MRQNAADDLLCTVFMFFIFPLLELFPLKGKLLSLRVFISSYILLQNDALIILSERLVVCVLWRSVYQNDVN